jgi:hypothetical protein
LLNITKGALESAEAEIERLYEERMKLDRVVTAQYDGNEYLRSALQMGVQLAESGGHGNGDNCPTCHFMREAKIALASAAEPCYDHTVAPDRATPSSD